MKEIFVREQKRTMRLVFKLTLHGKDNILTITTWAVAILRYKGGVLKGSKEVIISD